MNMLTKCGQQWEYRYVHGLKIPPGASAHVGSGVHSGQAADMRSKVATGALLDVAEIQDVARERVNKRWQDEGAMLTEDEAAQGAKAARGQAVDAAVALAAFHHAELAPTLDPVHVERPFRLQLPGVRDLIGYLDLQEPHVIRDLKISGKSPGRNDAVESLQLATYGLAAEVMDGVRPLAVALDHVVRLKRGPKIATVAATVGPETNRWVLARWRAADAQIESGVIPPAAVGSWWCSAKWCGYHDRCPYGAPQRKAIMVGEGRLPVAVGPDPQRSVATGESNLGAGPGPQQPPPLSEGGEPSPDQSEPTRQGSDWWDDLTDRSPLADKDWKE